MIINDIHIHINGIKALLKENGNSNSPQIIQIDEVWFNGFRHTGVAREKKDIPYYEESVLRTMANKNSILDTEDGSREISYMQGNSVAELLVKNEYHWNSSVGGGAICTDTLRNITFGNLLFPGDCAIQFFEDGLTDKTVNVK